MEHIRQFDWCSSEPDIHFVNEADIDRCVTERILRNKFHDPLLSSDEDEPPQKIDWSQVFKTKERNDERHHRVFVPGLRYTPPYPKLSALTDHQHYQLLKVLCSQNPHVLEAEFMPRPTKQDHRVFQELQETYVKEQQEFVEWAKTLWTNQHCIRALRPKPTIETVYEAEFNMRANEMESFPKNYNVAAQIPLETKDNKCEIVHQKDLTKVNITDLPQIECPDLRSRLLILQPCTAPEPCNKHPCRFVLPNETNMSILPLTEVHRELAQYAFDNGACCIASEKALKCLLEVGGKWTLPLSVCESISPDGDKSRVLVLGSEFYTTREDPRTRTYRAFRHLLQHALVPTAEQSKYLNVNGDSETQGNKSNGHNSSMESLNDDLHGMDVSSDDEEHSLVIDTDNIVDTEMAEPEIDNESSEPVTEQNNSNKSNTIEDIEASNTVDEETKEHKDTTNENNSSVHSNDTEENGKCKKGEKEKCLDGENGKSKDGEKKPDDYYNCSCKDSIYARPPPRSFKKWQVRNVTKNEKYDIIVHCPHKVRGKSGEVVLEPIPEYQIELGGTKQSEDRIRTLALSLFLRRNASLLSARIDGTTGDVITAENIYYEEFVRRHGNQIPDVSNSIYTAVDQLQGLLPGNYVIHHEPSHGTNAILYARCSTDGALRLQWPGEQPSEADEAQQLKTAPALAPILLPIHKFRKVLPLAFTPHERFVAKEPKKPITRQRTPPQAIKWPKKKQKKKLNIAQ